MRAGYPARYKDDIMNYCDFPIYIPDVKSIAGRKPVHGIGINDADYQTQPNHNGVKLYCKVYAIWRAMMQRCYSEKFQSAHTTYVGCTVDERWHSFMEFRKWMIEQQDWEELHLDKDLLVEGNKVYGPDTCVLITQNLNAFMTEKKCNNSGLPIGVHLRCKKWVGYISDGTGKNIMSKPMPTIDEASKWYKSKKCEFAIEHASRQKDERISAALIRRYSSYQLAKG